MSLLKIQIKYRAFSTAAKMKPVPFWIVVLVEFLVLVAVFTLGGPNSNWGESFRSIGPQSTKPWGYRKGLRLLIPS
jgi:hypothetical protein